MILSNNYLLFFRQLMRELMIFSKHVFEHLKQDWTDVIERAGNLWSPRWREVYPNQRVISDDNYLLIENHNNELNEIEISTSTTTEKLPLDRDEGELIEEEQLLDIYIPGRIMHIYAHRGRYKAMIVNKNFTTLRKIEIQGNIFKDHSTELIINALHEVIAVRNYSNNPPEWKTYNSSDICSCCYNKFTWHSTFRGKAQEYREKHNCHHCGNLVCEPCSMHKYPIAKYGLIYSSRICDKCVDEGNFASFR